MTLRPRLRSWVGGPDLDLDENGENITAPDLCPCCDWPGCPHANPAKDCPTCAALVQPEPQP